MMFAGIQEWCQPASQPASLSPESLSLLDETTRLELLRYKQMVVVKQAVDDLKDLYEASLPH